MFSKKTDDELVNGIEELVQTSESELATHEDDSNYATSKFLKPSVISEGFEFTGEIKAAGSLTVEGSIVGKVSVDNLIVGVAGAVDGTVSAKTINVKGKLSGDISCTEITVGGRSTVEGQLTYSSIMIQRGGSVKGDLKKLTNN